MLAGCLEYDMGKRSEAECTRRVAHSLGQQAGHAEIVGWAHEMSAWFALTQGRYRQVVEASRAGLAATSSHPVAAQLHAQEAKSCARLGDRNGVKAALERGRALLDGLPDPDHPEHHFVVDPAKQDFYEMDCYRIIGDDQRAADHAHEVLRLHTNPDGSDRAPMRMAEARLTLATVATRRGELEQAMHGGMSALEGKRQSLPSLLSAGELAGEMTAHYPHEAASREYAAHVRDLRRHLPPG